MPDMIGWLTLQGAHNVRDVGGLPARGGRTRPGVLVRADALDALTAADVEQLVATVGLAHVIDLRSSAERAERGRGLLGATSATYSELEIISAEYLARRLEARVEAIAAGTDPTAIMSEGYLQMLDVGASAFVDALRRLVAPGGTPALVHCAAGKDRTGILVALLLCAAGVDRDAIVADYAATAERMPAVTERLQLATSFHTVHGRSQAFVLDARAETMVRFLDRLERIFGGAAAFFVSHGAEPELLEAWRRLLIADND